MNPTRLMLCLLVFIASCTLNGLHDALPEDNAVFPIRENRLWGVIDRHGRVLVEPAYTDVSRGFEGPFSRQTKLVGQEGALLISENEWLYVDPNGTKRIDPMIDDVFFAVNFGDSLFGVVAWEFESDKHGTIPDAVFDPSGRWNPPEGVLPRDLLSEGMIVISQDGKMGYANREGAIIVEPEYDLCYRFAEGLAGVKHKGKWGYINTSGRWVIDPRFTHVGWFDQGIARVVEPGREKSFFINQRGEELFEWPLFVDAPARNIFGYSQGLMGHKDPKSGLYGFIDPRGEWRIQPTFKRVRRFTEGLAPVEYFDQIGAIRHGYIDRTGEIRVELMRGTPNQFRYGLGGVDTRSIGGYVNRAGEWVWPPKWR